ncbi:hypothetical protein Sgly_2140 [Syntrophobotulus glycolicus DSM 8271]|uniref:Uncharacterized protein n=1 Tax=Syntrophobotulus glycolicus (strain DSM 8271 / FlGlyR) TaxID=645991 RepID=F0T2N0_SYNGF|nr:hypothetical protein [Syntrophobotulus glycolicus]ADY56429.1 hypothetical protein Sgly_2140 [Syntrophobotulus glycolicus DSM 8271]
MTFSYLPAPVYIIFVLILGVLLVFELLHKPNKHHNIIRYGQWLLVPGIILAAFAKFLQTAELFKSYYPWLILLITIIAFIAVILIMIGAYLDSKSDPKKRKKVIRLIFTLIITLLILAAIIIPEVISHG